VAAEILALHPTLHPAASDPYAVLYNAAAEQQLLGILLTDNRYHEHVADIIKPEDFGNALHGRIYALIGELLTSGKAADPPTIMPFLEADEDLKKAGGTQYIIKLIQSVVTRLNAPHYAETIADLSRRRQVVALAQEAIKDAARPDPKRSAVDIADSLETGLIEVINSTQRSAPQRVGTLAQQSIMRTQQAYQDGGAPVVDTGLTDLDTVLKGLGVGNLVVVGGRPGMGKSAWGANLLFNAARAGIPGMMFSLEMTGEELTQRWIAGMTGIPTDKQRHGKIEPDQWQDLVDAQAELEKLPIWVDEQQRLSVGQLRARTKRLKRRHGIRVIVVDYLQLMAGDRTARMEKRFEEVSQITRDLKGIAKELGIVVVALSQLSREVEKRDDKRPMLSDLRESGSIEQDADVVMLLYREEYYLVNQAPRKGGSGRETDEQFSQRLSRWEEHREAVRGIAEINVAKQRHGKSALVKVAWSGTRQKFSDLYRGDQS
jgi:replicative DNA helicase